MYAGCEAYDELIAQSINIQLLGIGLDGHVGFNESDSHFKRATHRVVPDLSAIDANARLLEWRDGVPRNAVTMSLRRFGKLM